MSTLKVKIEYFFGIVLFFVGVTLLSIHPAKVYPARFEESLGARRVRDGLKQETEIAEVAQYYGDMFAYVISNYEPDSDVYRFFNEARDPRNWILHPEWGASLGLDEDGYSRRLSEMTIEELVSEYNNLEPDEFVHQDIGQTLLQLERIYFCEHLLGRTLGSIISYDTALVRMPDILAKDPSFKASALAAKKKMLLFREWAYRHWDDTPKTVSGLIFSLKP